MKKLLYFLLFIIPFSLLFYWLYFIHEYPVAQTGARVVLLSNPLLSEKYGYVINAYKSVLEEEGIPFEIVPPSRLIANEASEIIKDHMAIILPDGASQILPEDMNFWIREYLEIGGNVIVIFDSGTKNRKGYYHNGQPFAELTGVNYNLYNKMLDNCYTSCYIKFKDEKSIEYFQIPQGKISDSFFLSGYQYGKLKYPVARAEYNGTVDENSIYAYAISEEGDEYPVIVLEKHDAGNILYVNLPLGHLKANSDDLPLRAILRTFLFKIVKIPHLLNVPYGKGGLVINWHIDWKEDRDAGIPFMLRNGYFKENMEYSMHITAGDFNNFPGDNLGFDAKGKGRRSVESLLKYSTIGSHGGWGHNWFSEKMMDHSFSEAEIEEYIVKNNQSLESITGYPIIEYSAPNGVHPQPLKTRILEKLGFLTYYYAGDSGSMLNRTFYDSVMVSEGLIAFPVMPLGKSASFYEMHNSGISEDRVREWLLNTLSYVIDNRTVRLLYSHTYDVPPFYPGSLKEFINIADGECKKGNLYVKPMTYFSEFLLRFLKTEYQFISREKGIEISLKNPEGLDGVAIAIPKDKYRKPLLKGIDVEEDKDYFYLILKEKLHEKDIYIDTS